MKDKLLSMIEVFTRLAHGDDVDTWHHGRFLEKWADPLIVRRLRGCFSDYDLQALILALRQQMDLYHDLTSEVTKQRNLPYPDNSRVQILEWLTKTYSNLMIA
jgi:aminoglycoside 6-adenylyltransferase